MDLATSRVEVYARSLGRCERCGDSLGSSWACHHRKLRSQGGGNGPENLAALCHPCHNLGKHAVHLNPAAAYAAGWLVASWDDPALVPVQVAGALGLLWLDPAGGYAHNPPERPAP